MQMKKIAHHQETDEQAVPKQWAPCQIPPQFYCWAWHHKVWNTPSVSWGQLSQLCLFPTFYAPPTYSLSGQSKEQKRPWSRARTA